MCPGYADFAVWDGHIYAIMLIGTATPIQVAGDKMGDVDREINDLNDTAVKTLKEVLESAESDDVRRKAAVDILGFSNVGKAKGRAPEVTSEQLDHLGRVILEAAEVHRSLEGSKGPVAGTA